MPRDADHAHVGIETIGPDDHVMGLAAHGDEIVWRRHSAESGDSLLISHNSKRLSEIWVAINPTT